MSKQQSLVQIGGISMTKEFEIMLKTNQEVKPKTKKMARKTSRFSKLGALIALENQGCFTLVKRYDLN